MFIPFVYKTICSSILKKAHRLYWFLLIPIVFRTKYSSIEGKTMKGWQILLPVCSSSTPVHIWWTRQQLQTRKCLSQRVKVSFRGHFGWKFWENASKIYICPEQYTKRILNIIYRIKIINYQVQASLRCMTSTCYNKSKGQSISWLAPNYGKSLPKWCICLVYKRIAKEGVGAAPPLETFWAP